MKKARRILIGILACIMFLAGMCMNASAAKESSDEEINGGTINVTSKIEVDGGSGDIEVTTESSRFYIDSAAIDNNSGNWKPGQIPKAKVILRASDGYRFSARVTVAKITVKGGDCTSVKRLDSGEALELTLRLKPVSGDLGVVEDVFWVSSTVGKGMWSKVDNAYAYQLKLYRENTMVKTIDKTTTTTFDFYPYMTKEGVYTFRVRAIPRNTDESSYLSAGEWQYSDEIYIDKALVADGSGQSNSANSGLSEPGQAGSSSPDSAHPQFGWAKDGSGWWYHENDGSFPVNRWSYINNKWYLFDMAGYMRIGWQKWNDKNYYLSVNGDMASGWLEDNKKWYYMGTDGAMQTGWVQLDGKWYYLMSDGVRAKDWNLIGKNWYYFYPETGVMASNSTIGSRNINNDGVWVQ